MTVDDETGLPVKPSRWDWGAFLSSAVTTASNVLGELADFAEAVGEQLMLDYAARRQERHVAEQDRLSRELETLSIPDDVRELDE